VVTEDALLPDHFTSGQIPARRSTWAHN